MTNHMISMTIYILPISLVEQVKASRDENNPSLPLTKALKEIKVCLGLSCA